MRESALELLACPGCCGKLMLHAQAREGEHVLGGELRCAGCLATFVIERGIPRFAREIGAIESRTADAFGYEWTNYSELAPRYHQQFLDWIRPVEPAFFQGKRVLEGGCGKGRHTALAAKFGVRDILAMDLSVAVEAAFANTRHLPNVHIVQADLNHPPAHQVFDYVFSIGVLHHLSDPEQGFHALVSRLRLGGTISAWVYSREGNGWIVHLVTPVREHVTSHLPHAVLDGISFFATLPVWSATKMLYGPLRSTGIGRRLPYADYLSYIADFPFREQRSIVFDHLVAPVAYYFRREEFAAWFERAGLQDITVQHHNANSWRGFGRKPAGTRMVR